jgi:glycosyltransferase involved in cell wall biosynthesis
MEDWIDPRYEQGLVSVIIPCHNQERFLLACLESITDQEYRPIEVIIVDDGSSDGTRQIMNLFQSTQREGILVDCIHLSKQGQHNARNRGCRQARGEFIQYLDGDDILYRGKLSEQVTVFKNNSEVDVVYGDGQYLVDFGGTAKKGKIISVGTSSDMIETLLFGYWQPNFSYLTRRSAVQLCGPWDITIQVAGDFEYFLRVAIQGSHFRYKAGVTGLYRKYSFNSMSEQSASIRGRTKQRILAQAEHLLRIQGEFNEQRVRAMIENHRRIASQAYTTDVECFNNSIDAILRLYPEYQPIKRRARLISSMIGFRNYEKVAALISSVMHRNKKDWF